MPYIVRTTRPAGTSKAIVFATLRSFDPISESPLGALSEASGSRDQCSCEMPLAVVPTLTASLPYSRSPDLHYPPGQQDLPGAPATPCSPRVALLPIRRDLEDSHRIQ